MMTSLKGNTSSTILLVLATIIGSSPATRVHAVEFVAHRGASWDAPENTLASIDLAWKQGADFVEFDIQASRDGQLVLAHDKDLRRVAGVASELKNLTAEELSRIDVGLWKDKLFKGVTIPCLRDVLEKTPPQKGLFIEVKAGPEVVPELVRVLKASSIAPVQTKIISFDTEVIKAFKEAMPDRDAYWIVRLRKGKEPPRSISSLIDECARIKADGLDLSADSDAIKKSDVDNIRRAGLKWYVWTVNDASLATKMIRLGADGITTDRPGWLRDRMTKQESIRVMSFNIRFGTAKDGENNWMNRKELLIQTIKNFGPDVLGTQETVDFQRDFLKEQLTGYECVAAGREDGENQGESVAIYYSARRFEKLSQGHFWLSETPEVVGSKGWDAALPRIATWLKLKDKLSDNAKPFFYLNTHFDHRGGRARLESAKLIRAMFEKLAADMPIILTGDFNSASDSPCSEIIFGTFLEKVSPIIDSYDSFHSNQSAVHGTFNGFNPNQINGNRIDWIGCSTDWQVLDADIDRTSKEGRVPSDHFPVTAELLIKQ